MSPGLVFGFGLGHLALLVPLALVLVWVAWAGRGTREDPAQVLRALRASNGPQLPEATLVGASSRVEMSRYDKETLYELIDGAAEAYLARGFEQVAVTTYSFPGGTGALLEISAEAHRFSSEKGARELMAMECPRSAGELPGLGGAFADAGVLFLVKGRDLLKLTALPPDPRSAEGLRNIARGWLEEAVP